MKGTLLLRYCKEHWKFMIVIGSFYLIFGLVFRLQQIPFHVILYPCLLWSFIIGILAVRDLTDYVRGHEKRMKILQLVDLLQGEQVEASGLVEEDYQRLLEYQYMEKQQQIDEVMKEYRGVKEYITMWAHQIKTPITALELLYQEGLLHEKLEISECQAKLFEIEQYVDITLQYMRLDNVNSDLVLQTISMDAMIKEMIKYFRKTFFSKKLSLDYIPCHLEVVTDEKWLVFVGKQILSNALKYTSEGGIRIAGEEVVEGTQTIRKLIIEDTGIGIAKEDLPRILEKAYTGYNGRMDKKATGIGLYLSKEILQKLNHQLVITSEEGRGTRVEILFPVANCL